MINQVSYFRKRRLLVVVWLFPVILLFIPLTIYYLTQITARSATISLLQNNTEDYLPSGLSPLETIDYFSSRPVLSRHYSTLTHWSDGYRSQEAWINRIISEYFMYSLFFWIFEITIISVSLLAFKYRKQKIVKAIEETITAVSKTDESFRTFFQVLCSLGFGISFFFLGQLLNLSQVLRTDIFKHFALYDLPVEQTWISFENIISNAWNFFHYSWIFYNVFCSSIILLIGLFFSDTNILSKPANVPFFALKLSTVVSFLIYLVYISTMIV